VRCIVDNGFPKKRPIFCVFFVSRPGGGAGAKVTGNHQLEERGERANNGFIIGMGEIHQAPGDTAYCVGDKNN
jgi:hypothetical protein